MSVRLTYQVNQQISQNQAESFTVATAAGVGVSKTIDNAGDSPSYFTLSDCGPIRMFVWFVLQSAGNTDRGRRYDEGCLVRYSFTASSACTHQDTFFTQEQNPVQMYQLVAEDFCIWYLCQENRPTSNLNDGFSPSVPHKLQIQLS